MPSILLHYTLTGDRFQSLYFRIGGRSDSVFAHHLQLPAWRGAEIRYDDGVYGIRLHEQIQWDR
jgi:hypothetical protein